MRTRGRSLRVLLRTLASQQIGAELFEFALVLPVLFTLLLGIIWIGRAYNVYETITRAAREGTLYAVLPNCASCGDNFPDTYSSVNTCLTNPTNAFTSAVKPSLLASNLDPTKVQSYCQAAVVLNPDTDSSVQQCGVKIRFVYPVTLAIPFTSLGAATLNISTQVQMRMENQRVDNSAGNPQCP